MLHEFVAEHRDAIVSRTRSKVAQRSSPLPSTDGLENGIPLFLTQLCETLKAEGHGLTAFPPNAIGDSATRHGRELRALGFDVSQVVHYYGDICQAITELAVERGAAITVEEFHTLNRCLDTAIADAVTEHARSDADSRTTTDIEHHGQVAHETRDLVNTALFAYQALKHGAVAVNGSTGAVLGRSLMALRDLVDSTLSEIRMATSRQRRERLPVAALLTDIAYAAALHAEDRGLELVLEPVDADLVITGDPELLGSAVMNLLNNACKYTRAGGQIALRARHNHRRVQIEVQDECGGIPEAKGDPFQAFGERRGKDRTGLGLGLSMARKAVRAHGGDIAIHNQPGRGCVFVIDVPVAGPAAV